MLCIVKAPYLCRFKIKFGYVILFCMSVCIVAIANVCILFTHHLLIICISFIHCLLGKIAYFDIFRGFNCNFRINYKAYVFLIMQSYNYCSTRIQIFSHF